MTSTEEILLQPNWKLVQFFQKEKYSDTIKLGVQALKIKKKLDSKHPNSATAIYNLVLLYDKNGVELLLNLCANGTSNCSPIKPCKLKQYKVKNKLLVETSLYLD